CRARNGWSSPASILQAAWNSATMTAMPRQPTRHPTSPRLMAVARTLWCAVLLAWMQGAHAQMGPIEPLDAFPSAKLEISEGKKVRHVFQVWLADTPARQAQGLMFVRSLPQARGMLFVHDAPRP